MDVLGWLLVVVATAAPSASREEIRAALQDLYSPQAATRIAGAAVLTRTPPELVSELAPSLLPCVEARVRPQCDWHNHALYHLERVLAGFALASMDAGTPWGRSCSLGYREHGWSCPPVSHLRQLASGQNGFPGWDDDQLPADSPPDVRSEALDRYAHAAIRAALDAPLPPTAAGWDAWAPFVAEGPAGVDWRVLVRCTTAFDYGTDCRWFGRLERAGQVTTSALRTADQEYSPPRPGAVPQQLRVAEGGAIGVLESDGACCGDDRLHVAVFSLPDQLGVCEVGFPLARDVTVAVRRSVLRSLSVEAGVCRWRDPIPGAALGPLPVHY